MNSRVMVRPARTEDLPSVLKLERGAREAPHWSESSYRSALEDSGHVRRCLLVADIDGKIVGFAVGKSAQLADEAVAELESVAVAEEARRQGVGRALCAAVIAWCRESGARLMELEVRVGSSGAIALYENLGFVPAGRRRGYYRDPVEDAFVMVKNLWQ